MLGKLTLTATVALSLAAGATAAPRPADWGEAKRIDTVDDNHPDLNTVHSDGCPILSPDGKSLYMASNRPRVPGGSAADLNIWVSRRQSTDEPFGTPEILPEPVNSPFADFCPTPLRGGRLLFVSNRPARSNDERVCGMGDIYLTRLNPSHGWREPQHFDCAPNGPNTALDEQGPSYIDTGGVEQLFFSSSNAPSVPGDLFVSTKAEGGEFGPGQPISELNTDRGNEIQPNVRKDGREIVFSTNHAYPGAQGSQDLYRSTRASIEDPWSAPVNIGTPENGINTRAAETRPSLSWDGRTLLFGRMPGEKSAAADIFISRR